MPSTDRAAASRPAYNSADHDRDFTRAAFFAARVNRDLRDVKMQKHFRRFDAFALACALLCACGGGSSYSSASSAPPSAANAQVRFIDGAPSLETLINGVPGDLGPSAYLRVSGQTVASPFVYGSMTDFMPLAAGIHSLRALDESGYFVGPLKTPSLTAGHTYTLVVVGTYPNYEVLGFEEPKSGNGAALSLYEASPAAPNLDFGTFNAATGAGLTKRGSAHYGNVVTVSLGKSVTNLGGYVGHGTVPLMCSGRSCGQLTAAQVNSFDTGSALPFNNASRLSLFVFDPKAGGIGPVFGSLDL